jgi:hypothetical protein
MPWPQIDIIEADEHNVIYQSAGTSFQCCETPEDVLVNYRYLCPAPATPSAAAPAPLPTVAALGSGPPAGYVPCERGGCIRWTYVGGGEVPCCWTCFCGPSPMPATAAQHPDWTPPGATAPAPRPNRTPGITCRRCLLTSAGGVDHQPTCVVMREQGPSAVAAAPERQRDTFEDLCDAFDLLPEASR